MEVGQTSVVQGQSWRMVDYSSSACIGTLTGNHLGQNTLKGSTRHDVLSFLGLPYRILNINHKKELLRGLWV